MGIDSLYNLVYSIVAVGLSTYGISTIVAIEPGPFAVFDRIREALLPGCDEAEPVPEQIRLTRPTKPSPLIEPEEKQAAFDRTLKGSIHGILDCAICLGAWLVFPIMLLPVWMGLIDWHQYALAGLAAYGLHRLLLGVAGDI